MGVLLWWNYNMISEHFLATRLCIFLRFVHGSPTVLVLFFIGPGEHWDAKVEDDWKRQHSYISVLKIAITGTPGSIPYSSKNHVYIA